MQHDQHRYFIELQINFEDDVPRNREAEVRRAQAAQFIDHVSRWLQDQSLNDKVASIAITALGQVQMTCEEDVMNRLQEDEKQNIAIVRRSASLAESIQRVNGW
ncbi:MAG: hypothetical protein P4M13_10450 [Alphaproteobacteria bacterium]|nr:hypothetical protein [Alphaproteobacteria bacterium]